MGKLILKDVPSVVIENNGVDRPTTFTITVAVEERTTGHLWWRKTHRKYADYVYVAKSVARVPF